MESIPLFKEQSPFMADLLMQGFPESGWSLSDLERFMSLESCQAWGTFHEDSLIAFCLLQKAIDEAEILLLVVHPNSRKKNVGCSLLACIETEMGKQNIEKLFLEVSSENAGAILFYEKGGFTHMGTRKDYYPRKHNTEAYTMVKRVETEKNF